MEGLPWISADNVTYSAPIAVGTYLDDASLKTTYFTPVNARYIKIIALTEAGGRGPWTSIAEINVFTGTFTPPAIATSGSWGLTIDFPVIPVSAAIEWSSGRLLVWSSYAPSTFQGGNGDQTVTAIYDPSTTFVTPRTVTNTGHDMFCEGLSMDANGNIVAVGGNSDYGTSIYNSQSDAWTDGGVSILSVPEHEHSCCYSTDCQFISCFSHKLYSVASLCIFFASRSALRR